MNLTLTTNNAEFGSVTGAGSYDAGTSVTATATAKEGYVFLAWFDNQGRIKSSLENYTFIINEDTSLQAMFISELDNLEIYGFDRTNCRHRVPTTAQVIHLIQEMLANGGQVPEEFVSVTAVNAIVEQNTGKPLRLFVGTQAEYDAWTGDKVGLFAIITDCVARQMIFDKLTELETSVSALSNRMNVFENRLANLGFKLGSATLNSEYNVVATQNELKRQGNCVLGKISISGAGFFTLNYINHLVGVIPEEFRPKEDVSFSCIESLNVNVSGATGTYSVASYFTISATTGNINLYCSAAPSGQYSGSSGVFWKLPYNLNFGYEAAPIEHDPSIDNPDAPPAGDNDVGSDKKDEDDDDEFFP